MPKNPQSPSHSKNDTGKHWDEEKVLRDPRFLTETWAERCV
jgi:hypothetical protein